MGFAQNGLNKPLNTFTTVNLSSCVESLNFNFNTKVLCTDNNSF